MSALENLIGAFIQQLSAQNLPNFNSALVGLVQLLLTTSLVHHKDVVYPDYGPEAIHTEELRFDIIVVGAGSAGSALAGRLSEANYKVLVIEAGGAPQLCSEVPKLFPCMFRSFQDWQYISVDQNVCKANNDNGCYTPRGKCIGGSSSMNLMYAIINSYCVYRKWAQKYSCKGWDIQDVLKYFKKLEGYASNPTNSPYLGTKGPVTISPYWPDPFDDFLLKSGNEDGYRTIPDINIGINEGYSLVHATIRNGRRCNAAKAYITPVKNRNNFKLIQNAIVTKLIFGEHNRVIGVVFSLNGKLYKAYADLEVILSAGAIGSPLILMLSGIGPPEQLAKNQIQVRKKCPVGKYLWDHVSLYMWFYFDPTTSSIADLISAVADYMTNKTGPFSGIGTMNCVEFTVPVKDECGSEFGHIESFPYYFQQNSLDLPVILSAMNYRPEFAQVMLDANKKYDIMLVVCSLLDPRSHGIVGLNGVNGADAFINPYINYKYLSDSQEYDLNSLIDAALDQVSRLHTKAYKNKNGGLLKMNVCNEHWPDDNITFTREYFKCLMEYFVNSAFHACGTCRMGPKDRDTVVNTDLRVHDISGLRVCDASIMPYITASNTNLPSIMIGERCADFVKDAHKRSEPSPRSSSKSSR